MFSRSGRDRNGRWGAGALRTLFAVVMSVLLAWTGIAGATPAQAAGGAVPTIVKSIDNQKAAYDKGDTVTYRLNIQCSSLEDPCVTGTVTDVLDPNLQYTSFTVGRNTVDGATSKAPVTLSQSGQTLTFTVGDATDPNKYFLDGESMDIVVNAKVIGVPTNAGRTIDNSASIVAPGTPTDTDGPRTIVVNPEAPAVYDWNLIKTRVAPSGNPAIGGEVTYDIRFTRPYNSATGRPVTGGVDIASFVLKDAIPAGGEYVNAWADNASGSASYDAGTNTVTFPSAAISASELYCGNPCISFYVAHIVVKYPAPTFKAGDEPVNKANAVITYANGHPSDTLNAEAKVTLNEVTKSIYTSKSNGNPVQPTPGEVVSWTLQSKNTGNVGLESLVITDQIPEHLSDVQVGASEWWMPKEGGNGSFDYFDGSEWKTLGSLNNATATKLSVPAGAKAVRMTVSDLGVDRYSGFQLFGTVDADTPVGWTMENCMSYDGSVGPVLKSNCATYTIKEKPQANVYTGKAHQISNGGNHAVPGEEFSWMLEWRTIASKVPTTTTVTDLLPSQFELVTENPPCLGYKGYWENYPSECGPASTNPAYTTEAVAGGTKITFADMALPVLPSQSEYKYLIRLKVRVKDGAPAADYTNKMTVALPATHEATCNWGSECSSTDVVTIDTAAAAGLQKWDKGSEPNVAQDTAKASANCPDWDGFTRFPCVAQTLPGGDFGYRLKWSNQGNVPLTNAVVYDVLPYVGDTGVGEVLSSADRKTEWMPVLTGPIAIDAGLSSAAGSSYLVEYNLTTNPCRPELKDGSADGAWQGSCDNNWVTTVADWSTVKSFRIRAFEAAGSEWAPGTRLVFTIPMKAPADAPKSKLGPVDLSIAWNSAAQRVFQVKADGSTVRLQATEPRKVGIIIPAPYVSIGDYVWFDANRNGKQDAGELPAEGVKVTLKTAGGTVVGTTTTDADGYYWFQNLTEKTDYVLEFEKPAGYDWTSQDKGSDDAKDSDVDPATSKIEFTSPTWISGTSHNLGGANKADDPTLDAGLVLPATLVSVGDFVWWDADRDGLQDANEDPIEGVAVQLYDKEGGFVDEVATDSNGYYAFTGLVATEAYTIKFISPLGAVLTAQNAGGVVSNSPSGDVDDSDADPVTGTVEFTAEADGDNLGDPNKADNPGIDAGYIAYNLVIDKELKTVGTVYPSNDVIYSITPKNEGPVAALGGWSVTDLLPAGLTMSSMSGTGYTCVVAADKASGTCTNDPATALAAGESGAVITVVAKVSASATGSLKNVAYVDKAPADIAETVPVIVPTLDKDTANKDTDNDDEAVVELTVPLVSVGDYVWFDTNRDGLQTAGEDPVSGVTVNLYKRGESTVWKTTTTDANGYYGFKDLVSLNDYTIEFVKPAGATFTVVNAGADLSNSPTGDVTDSDADPLTGKVDFTAEFIGANVIEPNQADNPGIDAGFIKYNLVLDKQLTTTGSIRLGQDVTYTLNPTNEGPVDAKAGWSVTDLLPAGLTLKSIEGAAGKGYTCTKVSDSKGVCTNSNPLLADTSGGLITVVATVGEGLSGTLKNVAYVAPAEGDAPETNPLGEVPTKDTNTGNTTTDNDDEEVINLKPLVSIGDYVWFDNDRDGLQEASEPKYVGMTVELWDAAGTTKLATTTTDADGYYFFKDLEAATDYEVHFIKKADESFTAKTQGSDTAIDSNPVTTTGVAKVKTPATGKNLSEATKADDPTIDAGIVKYNLILEKERISEGPFYENGSVNFTLTPSNEGPAKELVGWSVTDLLPPGLTVRAIGFDPELYECDDAVGATEFTCTAKVELAAGETGAPITVVAKIGDNFVGKLHNVAFVSPSPEGGVPESVLLNIPTQQTRDGWGTKTGETLTDNDAEAELEVLPKVSVGDFVWFDTNRDGLQDETELPVPGLTVNLYDAEGVLVGTKVTDPAGYYFFDDLMPSEPYTIEFVKPANTLFTQMAAGEDRSVDSNADVVTGKFSFEAPASGQNLTEPGQADDPTIDAGLVKLVSVGDFVWYDTDKDGVQDETELPVAGVTVNLIDGDKVIKTTTTDAEGFYYFTDLETTKAYTIEFVKPVNTTFTAKDAGSEEGADEVDSDADPVTGKVEIIAPSDGYNGSGQGEVDEDDPTIDAGLIKLVSVGDYVWYDVNRDGLQTAGEAVVPDVTVNLYDEAGVKVATTKTDANGYYAFGDLLAETKYTIEFVKPADSSFTTALAGDTTLDSNADPVTGKYSITTPASGLNLLDPGKADDPTIDAGLVKYNLKITKTRTTADLVHRGETVTFEIVPSNDGPVAALAGWSVTDLLPDQLVLVSMSGVGYQCLDNVCVADAPLAAGASGNPITVIAKPMPSFKGKVWNVAYVAPAAADITETIVLGELPTNLTDTAVSPTDNDDQDYVRITPALANEDDGDDDTLAFTGNSGTAAFLGTGLLLLAVGGGLILTRRRRSVN